jgi:hypothetical protein
LALVLAVLVAFWVSAWKKLPHMEAGIRRSLLLGSMAASVGFGVDAFNSPSWQYAQTSMFLWLVLGMGCEIRAPLVHDDFKGLHAYFDRHNHYSSWEASRFLSLQSPKGQKWTRRQRIKYRLLRSPLFPLLYFLGSYGLKGGFRDGVAGLRFSVLKAFYFYQIQLKVEEVKARSSTSES